VAVWFTEIPLDFTRDETGAAANLIAAAYNTNDDLIALAENIGLNTAQLPQGATVDKFVREMLKKARLADRLVTLIAVVLMDQSRAGIHDQLRELVAGHESAIRDAGLRRKPSLATLQLLPPTIEAWGPDDADPQPGFERLVNAVAGFLDPAKFRRGIAEAETRTARIEIGGKAQGTGFLVATDLLMTNWHVVERGVDGAVARFDHSDPGTGRAVAFADNWDVAHSLHDSETNELGPEGPPDGTWDFALVRLAEPVGDQALGPDPAAAGAECRGHYPLDWGPYDFDQAEPLLILGHPDGGTIQLSHASPAGARFTSLRNRVRYDTNTSRGSSGSPVFNHDFRIVALHNSSGKGSGAGMFNQGVPIAGIGGALRAQLAGKPDLTALGLV
jgi:hypothetical protein